MSVIVEIANLRKSYRRGDQVVSVLQDINFNLERGEFVALMGPSGSGKSTLLNLIAGIDSPDSGRLEIEGVDITGFGACDGAAEDVCLVVDIKDIRKGKVQDVLLAPNDKVVVSRRRF